MSQNRGNPRNDRHDFNNDRRSVRADPRAMQSRQRDAATKVQTAEVDWIKPGEPTERACLQIRQGKLGRYPIFGLKLKVEERRGRDEIFPALVFYGAKPGVEGLGLNEALKEGFWIGVSELDNDPSREFKDELRATLILTLLAQPEMQLALDEFRREQAAAIEAEQHRRQEQERKMAENRQKLLANLRKQFGTSEAAPATEKMATAFNSIEDMLTATSGSIEDDGITIYITRAPENGYAVRVKNVPEDHVLSEVAKKNIFALQDALYYADDRTSAPTDRTGNKPLGYQLRTYLRGRLMRAGVVLAPPTDGTCATNGDSGSVPLAEESSQGKDQCVEASQVS